MSHAIPQSACLLFTYLTSRLVYLKVPVRPSIHLAVHAQSDRPHVCVFMSGLHLMVFWVTV